MSAGTLARTLCRRTPLESQALINTLLQQGVIRSQDVRNRFNGVRARVETVETVSRASGTLFTPLKRGVNERVSKFILLFVLFFGLAAELLAQQPADEEGRTRFCAVDIFVDSGSSPLAAYQLRFAITNGAAKIVGIEGGEHPAFRQPPFYDPKAIQNEVAIIASFNIGPASELPIGKTRVATIHLQNIGTARPQFEVKLQTAADTQGNRISCQASFEQRKSQ